MTITLLASFPSPAQGVWHLGPVPIRAYALFIIIGIVAALVIGDRRWEARGGERGVIYDIALWAVPFGLIGGRLYHVITDWQTYFGAGGAGPIAALRIWDGGLGIWGAVALGGVGAWIGCKRRGIPLPAFGDAIAPGIVLAQAIGRIGNYFNQELYGRETDVPWGMEIFYRRDPSGIIDVHSLTGVSTGDVAAVVHPTFLYELLWNLLVFVALIYIDRRFRIGHGRLFALYVAGYCIGRFGVELLRADVATQIEGIRINSFTATFVFIGAVVYFILAPKGREDPASLRGDADDRFDEADGKTADVSERANDLAAVGATAGIVAAATVAGGEDEEHKKRENDVELEAAEAEPELGAAEVEPELGAAEVEPELEAAEPEPELEAAEPEPELEAVESGADEAEADEAEPVESAAPTDADDVDDSSEDEAIVEAEVTVANGLTTETAVEAEDADLIDEDHDPIDEDDLESLQDADVAAGIDGPTSEQQEELEDSETVADEGDSVADEAEEEAADEALPDVDESEETSEETADDAPDFEGEGEFVAPVDGPISEQQEELLEEEEAEESAETDVTADETAVDDVTAAEESAAVTEAPTPPVTTPPPSGTQQPASRLGKLFRRRRS